MSTSPTRHPAYADLPALTDEAIAAKYGLKKRRVANWRAVAGMPKNSGSPPRNADHLQPHNEARRVDLSSIRADLGIVPDKTLAIRAGVSWERVRTERVRLGIAMIKGPRPLRLADIPIERHEPEPAAGSPVRRSVVTPSAPIDCSFTPACPCPPCKRERMIEERQRRSQPAAPCFGNASRA